VCFFTFAGMRSFLRILTRFNRIALAANGCRGVHASDMTMAGMTMPESAAKALRSISVSSISQEMPAHAALVEMGHARVNRALQLRY